VEADEKVEVKAASCSALAVQRSLAGRWNRLTDSGTKRGLSGEVCYLIAAPRASQDLAGTRSNKNPRDGGW
jgi:hypothetical protein